METSYVVPSERYARCIASSKRVRWDIETDVIRGRRFDRANKFLPDGLTLVNRLDFLSPVNVGEIVILQAQVNFAARTSMEVGCRVETEHMHTGVRRNVTKAYLTFVAVDELGRPRPVRALELVTDEDHRRHREAMQRREARLRAAGRQP